MSTDTVALISTPGAWTSVLEGSGRPALEAALPAWLADRRWFGGKARRVAATAVVDAVPLGPGEAAIRLALVEVTYADGEPDVYAVPLAFAAGAEADRVRTTCPGAAVASVRAGGRDGLLHSADGDPGLARCLAEAVAGARRFCGRAGEVVARATHAHPAHAAAIAAAVPTPLGAEQSNTSFRFGDAAVLKLFRRTAAGPNPDLEVGAFLTDVAGFTHVPLLLGGIEYRSSSKEPFALAILQAFVANHGDAWTYVLREVRHLLDAGGDRPAPAAPSAARAAGELPAALREHGSASLAAVRLLGRRTAELHLALASHPEVDAFRPEPLAPADVRALHLRVRGQAAASLALLETRRSALPPDARARADRVLRAGPGLERALDAVLTPPPASWRTRTHGDYHLGQVLWTGSDFVVIDFEGEPARPLAERRDKTPPVRDVAGMIRSFHYAAYQALASRSTAAGAARAAETWARCWYRWAVATYLEAYEDTWTAGISGGWRSGILVSETPGGRRRLLELFLAEKAFYELTYELNHRPDWAWLPLQGLEELAGAASPEEG